MQAEGALGRAGVAVATSATFLVFVSIPAPFGVFVSGEAWAAAPAGVTVHHRDHLGSSVVTTEEQGQIGVSGCVSAPGPGTGTMASPCGEPAAGRFQAAPSARGSAGGIAMA